MDIKDIAGLSEPLTRLIEVISGGLGALSKPYLIKKTAEAKAYEVKVIAEVMAESRKLLTNSEYDDGKIKVLSPDAQPDDLSALPNRVTARIQYQELQKQQNVESVCSSAADELAQETSVPDSKPEPEWVSRFMEIASGISTEEIQHLWGRILAGEIKQPGAFSLRTLDVLRNLSKKEVESFVKLANYVIRSGDKVCYLDPTAFIFTKEGGISFHDILTLKDAGLIFETDLALQKPPQPAGQISSFIYGSLILIFETDKDTPQLVSNVGVLTKVGAELLQLVTAQPDMDYVKFVGQRFRAEGMRFAWAPIHGTSKDQIYFGNKTYVEL